MLLFDPTRYTIPYHKQNYKIIKVKLKIHYKSNNLHILPKNY